MSVAPWPPPTGPMARANSRSIPKAVTDRIGNIGELMPYFPLWRSVVNAAGALRIVVVEHDAVSKRVSRIPKGKDGRALG